jgi:hypothetical protein
MVTIDDVRAVASGLPRSTEAFVRGRVKFRVGRIVYLAFSRDEAVMGFAFPKDWRDALIDSEPDKFMLPEQSDLRYNWVLVRLAALDEQELCELVIDAWSMVVPKSVAAAQADAERA